MATSQFDSFIKTLKKVFMLDQADLDFGIYRIMNQKRKDIEKYLNENLKTQITEVLNNNKSSQVAEYENELKEARKAAEMLGISPDDMPKVKELKAKIASLGNTEDLENEVYSHLSTFFGRYYDGGDFISQRRYKKDVYAIPYEGEEVKLHWANADQYYIKTSEYFRNYRFKLDGGKYVEFTLKEASTEQNNNKAQKDKERRFALYEECPVEVIDDELHINFTYELYPKATKQKSLIESAFNVVKDLLPSEFKMEVLALRPTDSDRSRTLLQKHLTDYVARNTFDYFIHKDLKGFLSRELDFYIKNEILEIDDIDARTTESFLAHLTVIKAIKNVGSKIIEFLASLENFQKRLWLKKKMVVSADYCITLDRVPEKFYAEICANDSQREEWVKLFAIDEIKSSQPEGFFNEGAVTGYSIPLTEQFLKENPFLVLDTACFTDDFKRRLISEIDDLDEKCDGLMIKSDNFQALRLLEEKYLEKVNCIYIDPPYNTDATKIIYKNGYEHSSWISLMDTRLMIAKKFLDKTGIIELAIDDYELRYINCCLEKNFGINNFISNISIFTNPKGRDQGFVAQSHDYSVIYAKDKSIAKTYNFKLSNSELLKKFSKLKNGQNLRELPLKRTGTGKYREERPYMFFPFLYHLKEKQLSIISKEEYRKLYDSDKKIFNDLYLNELKNKYEKEGYVVILPLNELGQFLRWRWGYDSCVKGIDNGILFCKQTRGKYAVYQYDMADDEFTPKSMWIGERYDASSKGTNLLNNIIPNNPFDYPKSVYTVQDNISLGADMNGLIFDFFAGSGTTAHAVINLNRNDAGERKYILVDMGSYFYSVIKTRIQKVIYSEDWNNGKPVSRKGSSHCFKYMRLEQYEDTLNNLVVKKNTLMDQEGEFFDGYMLGYLLDTETKDSLFSLDWFVNPWNTKLKITRNNETKEEKIDLVETFNYLIGLKVQRISYPKSDICVVEGYSRREEHILIIWRDCMKVSNEDLNEFFRRMAYSTRDKEYDKIYVNGDNNLENLKTDADTWKVTLIEQEFSKRMFEVE